MKSLQAFILAFCATLLMLVMTLFIKQLALAWVVAVGVLLVGSFVLLGVQIGVELFGARRSKWAGFLAIGAILTLAATSWSFHIFPYVWNAIVMLLLAGCLAWRLVCDYAAIFVRPKPPAPPPNWSSLERGEIPKVAASAVQKQKQRLVRSHGLRGTMVARIGQFGTVSHPLKLDE